MPFGHSSHNSSQSSIDVSGLQQHTLLHSEQQQHQQIRSYDDEDDDDVLMLNFNSPLVGETEPNEQPPPSSSLHAPLYMKPPHYISNDAFGSSNRGHHSQYQPTVPLQSGKINCLQLFSHFPTSIIVLQ